MPLFFIASSRMSCTSRLELRRSITIPSVVSAVAGLCLARRPDALDDLLVLLQIPPVREEHQNVTSVLQVQAVAGAGRMRE